MRNQSAKFTTPDEPRGLRPQLRIRLITILAMLLLITPDLHARARLSQMMLNEVVKDSFEGTITAKLKIAPGLVISNVSVFTLESTKTGIQRHSFKGKIADNILTIPDIEYSSSDSLFLRFETPDGVIEGWDASVPHSPYEIEQPLANQSTYTIARKIAPEANTAFDDEVYLLDIQGNITNAAALTVHLRTRPFIESSGENKDQWIWRASRWQWEDPNENSWVPWKDCPYYAIDRQRIKPQDYKTLNITYARHLGGLQMSKNKDPKSELTTTDLGTLLIPKPLPGMNAVNPDGTPIVKMRLKPLPVTTQPDSASKPKTDGAKK